MKYFLPNYKINETTNMIIIKNSKGEICDYRIPYDVDISEEIENMQKLIDACKQKMYETTMIPKNYINHE